MFISRQRNSIPNISEFIKEKSTNVNNSSNVDMNKSEVNIFEELSLKVTKLIMFNNNRLKLKNWFLQVELYFDFNSINEEKQKILFATTRMKNKVFNWIKSIMMNHLHQRENSTRIFSNFDNFKKKVRIIFEVINEIFTFKRVIQYFTQKTSIANYV